MFQSRFRFTQNSEKSQNWMGLTGIFVSCSNNYMFIPLGSPVKKRHILYTSSAGQTIIMHFTETKQLKKKNGMLGENKI